MLPSRVIQSNTSTIAKATKWELYLILLMMNQYNFLIIIMVRYGILMKIWRNIGISYLMIMVPYVIIRMTIDIANPNHNNHCTYTLDHHTPRIVSVLQSRVLLLHDYYSKVGLISSCTY